MTAILFVWKQKGYKFASGETHKARVLKQDWELQAGMSSKNRTYSDD